MVTISTQDTPLVDVLVGGKRLQNYVELVCPDAGGSVYPFIFDVRDLLPERVDQMKTRLQQEFYRMASGEDGNLSASNSKHVVDAEVERVFSELKKCCQKKFKDYGTFDEQGNLLSIQLPREVVAREREANGMLRQVAKKLPVVFQQEVKRSPKFVFVDGDTIGSIWPEETVGCSSGYAYSHNTHQGADYVLIAFPSTRSIHALNPEANLAHELTHVVKFDEIAAADPTVELAMDSDTQILKKINGSLLMASLSTGEEAAQLKMLKEHGLLANAKNFTGLPQWQKELVSHKHKAGFFKALNGDTTSAAAVAAIKDYSERLNDIIHPLLQVLPHSVEGKAALYVATGQNPADEAMPILTSLVAAHGTEAARALLPQTFEAATKALEASGIKPFDSRIGMGSGAAAGMH